MAITKKKLLSIVMALVMAVSVFPANAFATETETTIVPAEEAGIQATTNYVAEVNRVPFETLQDAIDAAQPGETVTILTDVVLTEGVTVAEDDEIVLDLNGCEVSLTKAQTKGYQMILNHGKLTINDSGMGGKLSYTDSGKGGEYISDTIYNCGTLVINGGTIENLSSKTVASNGYPHAVDTYSGSRNTSVTINGGTIYCAEYSAVRMFCTSAVKTADLVINGGTIMGAVDMQNGTKNAAIGSLTILGGNFVTSANKNNIRFANWNGGATEYGLTAEIKGGTFNGGITTQYVPAAANWNSKIISGGTFAAPVAEEYCAEGFVPYTYSDGSHGVIELALYPAYGMVAQIGDSYYKTVAEALAAIQDGETLVVLNVEGDEVKTELDFVKPGTFTITGVAPDYKMPIITVDNENGATVLNIENATLAMAELDARRNATINVYDSTITGANGNDIVKAYYNGVINVYGNTTINTMQVTVMGRLNLHDSAKITATWQSNIYGNGIVTIEDSAVLETAGLNVTGQAYSGRDNTDADRVGQPATILVDGGTLKTLDESHPYYYNATKAVVGADGTFGLIQAVNGGTVILNHKETVTVKPGSKIEVVDGTFKASDLITNSNLYISGSSYVDMKTLSGGAVISGGIYTMDVSEWCAEDYRCVDNGDGTYTVCEKEYVAKVGEKKCATLAEAFAAAQNGETVTIVADGTYVLSGVSGKTLTVKAAEGVAASIDMSKAIGVNGAKLSFENLTFNYAGNSTYKGIQHVDTVKYTKCTINGQMFLYGNEETFVECTFNNTSVNYNVWTYGAGKVVFEDCDFNCVGKSVLIYAESASLFNDVTIRNCTFTASASAEGKAAIEMDSSLTAGINLTVANATVTGFDNGSVSGNTLWNNKKGNATEANNDITVVVDGVTVLKPEILNPKAVIGEKKFETLQKAIDTATAAGGNQTIELLGTISEDVRIEQKEGVNLTILGDGENTVFTGSIYVDGNNRYQGTETLTIENVVFRTDKTDSHYFIDSNVAKEYAHNITVDGCTFEAPVGSAVAALRIRQGYNIAITNSCANGLHSMLQSYGCTGITIEKVTVEKCKSGFALGTSKNVVVKNTTISVSTDKGYGLRAETSGNDSILTVEDCEISAYIPVLIRNATGGNYALIVNGTNTMTGTNKFGYWAAVTADDFDGKTELAEPTAEYTIQINDAGLSKSDVYPYYVARIGNVEYLSLQAAINAATGNCLIELIPDVIAEDVTINQNTGAQIVIDGGSEKTAFTGTINIHGYSNYKGTETLTIKNIAFRTNESGHDFIRSADSNNGTIRYAHNVTVEDCTFNGTGDNTTVGIRIYQGFNIAVTDCTASGLHSLMQSKACDGMRIEGVTVKDCKSGFALGTSKNVVVKNTTISVNTDGGYGLRAETSGNDSILTVEDCEISAYIPVLIRNATSGNYTLIVNGTNTMTGTNKFGYWAAVTADDFDGKTELAEPTAEYTIQINDAGLSKSDVYPYYVAQIGNVEYLSLQAAINAAQNGDTVTIVADGTYVLTGVSGKTLTVKAAEGVAASIDMSKEIGVNGAKLSFENLTFNYAAGSLYKGIQHVDTVKYTNCTINGQMFLYGNEETFVKCTFNNTSVNYNVWTYGARKVVFEDCDFNCVGKSVLIYAESASIFNDVTVRNCTFTASASAEGKAAIEMDSSLTAGINLTVVKATVTGFDKGSVSGNTLWNNKKGDANEANRDITVVVDGETVLEYVHIEAEAVVENKTEATCTDDGSYDSVVYCSRCGKELSRKTTTVPALGHDYGKWTKVDENNHERVCTRNANHVEREGHSWNDGEITTAPTCEKDGVKTFTCTDCHATRTETVEKTGHDYKATVTAPTCTESGYTTYTCANDASHTYTADETEALGHDYGEWTKVDENNHERVCTRNANHVEREGHSWNDGEITTAPTCEKDGVKTFTCTDCHATRTETVEKTGHDYKATVTAPTCTENGYTTYTCANDASHTYTADETEALGHDYGSWYVAVASTYVSYGLSRSDCEREGCDHFKTRVLPPLVYEYPTLPDTPGSNENDDNTVEVEDEDTPLGSGEAVTIEIEISAEKVEEAIENGTPVVLEIETVTVSTEIELAPQIVITTNSAEEIPVEIPVENPTTGTVVVIVNADGTETVVPDCTVNENGVVADLPDGATVKIVDKAMSFDDVEDKDWFNDAVDFVSARGILTGVSKTEFGDAATTTHAMAWTLLARMAGVDTTVGDNWYSAAQEWVITYGITTDIADPTKEITREELFAMLWRFAGAPSATSTDLSTIFTDAETVGEWAKAAGEWAVENAVMNGMDGKINPQGIVTRAQLAQFIMNFINVI